MSLIKFFRGPKASYSAASTHKDALYFATDTNELIMNNNSYGDKIKDNGLTFTEVQSGANKGHVVATIELASGKTFSNVDLGVYGRSEIDSKIASVNSDATTLAGRVTTAEGNITSLNTRLTSAEGSITTLTAGSSTEGSVAYQIAQIVANAPASFDTLKEIADWIANDTTGAAKMASDIEALKTDKLDKSEMEIIVGDANGHEYVDFGLPSGTLWATMNVGAESDQDLGETYMYGKGATPYDENDSTYEGTEVPLDLSADTARQVWGGTWCTPTKEQWLELFRYCTITLENNRSGKWLIRRMVNGQSVFIRLHAKYISESYYSSIYMSSTKSDNNTVYAPAIMGTSNNTNYNASRRKDMYVRPVIKISKEDKYATNVQLDTAKQEINSSIATKQNTLTFDNAPTAASTNPVTSEGIKTYVDTADTTTNTRVTTITGQSGSTYTARATEGASYIKNSTSIQGALNDLDDAALALTTLLTWQEITPSPTPVGEALWRKALDFETNQFYILVDLNGKVIQAYNQDGSGGLSFYRHQSAPTDKCLARSYNDDVFAQSGNTWGWESYSGDQSGQVVTFDVDGTEYAITRGMSQQDYGTITPTPDDYE